MEAQELEPRAYSNAPVGHELPDPRLCLYQGDVGLDASAPIENAKLTAHSAVLGYAHAFGCGSIGEARRGASLRVGVGLRQVRRRAARPVRPRLGDPRVRVSALLYGGPALTLAEFDDYKPDFLVGASLAVTLPLGQYDQDKS